MTHIRHDSSDPVRPVLRTRAVTLVLAAVAIAVAGATMLASDRTDAMSQAAAPGNGPVVVELFTSQSCYSCPPAEAYLADLADRDGIVALEHHVDYWDTLSYGSAGHWKDVFSSPQATERQRVYAGRVGPGHSYTPQMVIDGRFDAVGSREGAVSDAIEKASRTDRPRLDVAARPEGANGMQVTVSGHSGASSTSAGIWIVTYLRQHVTKVTGGENHGKTLRGRNIVRAMKRIGDWHGDAVTIDLDGAKPDAEHGCAILVQPDGQGPILGAAYCNLSAAANS